MNRKQRVLLNTIRKAERLAERLGYTEAANALYGIGCSLGSQMVASR